MTHDEMMGPGQTLVNQPKIDIHLKPDPVNEPVYTTFCLGDMPVINEVLTELKEKAFEVDEEDKILKLSPVDFESIITNHLAKLVLPKILNLTLIQGRLQWLGKFDYIRINLN